MGEHKLEFYKDKKGEFRWKFTHANGNCLSESSEGYKNRLECIDSYEATINCSVNGVVHVFYEDEDTYLHGLYKVRIPR